MSMVCIIRKCEQKIKFLSFIRRNKEIKVEGEELKRKTE